MQYCQYLKKLEYLNGKYYAGHGRYWGNEAINQALAKLWLKWGKKQRDDWIVMVLPLKGTYKIGEYLDEEDQRELVYLLPKAFRSSSWLLENLCRCWFSALKEYAPFYQKGGFQVLVGGENDLYTEGIVHERIR